MDERQERIELATRLLLHYIRPLWEAAGWGWDFDHTTEVVELAKALIGPDDRDRIDVTTLRPVHWDGDGCDLTDDHEARHHMTDDLPHCSHPDCRADDLRDERGR